METQPGRNGIAQPRVALVTGAGRRIGRAIAEDLAAHGWAVAVHANRSRKEADDAVDAIRKRGGQAQAVFADLADVAAPRDLVSRTAELFGAPVTLLVNNASRFVRDDLANVQAEDLDAHHAIHVRAPSLLAQEMAAGLPEGGAGSIVNIIDQRVLKPTPHYYSYAISKAALWSATQMMAQALAPAIRVNAVAPGPTLRNVRQTDADFRAQCANLPLGAGPQPTEIAAAVRFLAEAMSVTGQMIAVDGGQHLAWQTPDVLQE